MCNNFDLFLSKKGHCGGRRLGFGPPFCMWLLLIFDRFVFLHGTAARKKQSAVGQSGRDQSCVARLVLLWVCYQVEVA
jgi:hypothetical protein